MMEERGSRRDLRERKITMRSRKPPGGHLQHIQTRPASVPKEHGLERVESNCPRSGYSVPEPKDDKRPA